MESQGLESENTYLWQQNTYSYFNLDRFTVHHPPEPVESRGVARVSTGLLAELWPQRRRGQRSILAGTAGTAAGEEQPDWGVQNPLPPWGWEKTGSWRSLGCSGVMEAASTVYSVLQSVYYAGRPALYTRPHSPKFQIFPSQLRQTADRAAGLSIKSLWVVLWLVYR
jgi:hypothetical protein